MAFLQYLTFDNVALPLPDSYEVSLEAVEADTTGETEAGTRQRDVIREGVTTIAVSFSVSAPWLKQLTDFSKKDSITVLYFNTSVLECEETKMYIEGFKVGLKKDTSYKGLWTVSFTLKEF